jgi:hypothetical protein
VTQDLEKTGRAAAEKLHNNRNAAAYKHVVVGIKKTRSQFDDLYKMNETNTRLSYEKNNKLNNA